MFPYKGNDGSVNVVDLAERLDISAVSIRKDLEPLEKQGMLQHVWGGAVLKPKGAPNKAEAFFERKKNENRELKLRVACAAADLVKDGDFYITDSVEDDGVVTALRHFGLI